MPYTRFVPFGLGRRGMRSQGFERRDKRSFRRWLRRRGKPERRYVTKSGAVLTKRDLERLADEAERGYCTETVWTEDDYVARCFRPLPCPLHTLDDGTRLEDQEIGAEHDDPGT